MRLRNPPDAGSARRVFDPEPTASHQTILRLGGLGALLSGVATLLTVGYTFGYLASLGLSVEMLDTPAALLPWLAHHAAAYLGLWWFFLLSLLCLLPTPLAVYALASPNVRPVALVGAAAGLGGIVAGVVGTAAITASAPVLARAFVAAPVTEQLRILLLSELAGALGLHLRLFAYLLLALWVGASAYALSQTDLPRARGFGWLLFVVAAFVFISAVGKLLGLFDLEPVLGVALALAYLAMGMVLLRTRGAGTSRIPPGYRGGGLQE